MNTDKPGAPYYQRSVEETLASVQSSPEGISGTEAATRLQQYGENALPQKPGKPAWLRFIAHFNDVLIYVLLAAKQKKLPFDLAAYSFVYVAVVLAPTWLLSGARYLYALATLPLLQAKTFESRTAHTVGLSVCAALLVVFTWGYTIAIAVL